MPRGNVDELTRAVVDLLKDEGLARRFGRAGRERVESRFNSSVMAERYLGLLRDLAAEKRMRSSPSHPKVAADLPPALRGPP